MSGRSSLTRALRLGPAAAHAALLFVLSAQPDLRLADDPLIDLIVRKLGHAVAFGLLGVLVFWGLAGAAAGRQGSLAVVLIVAAYAVSDEIHQSFVPGRQMSLLDVGIDTLGGAIGVAAARATTDPGRRIGRVRGPAAGGDPPAA